MKIFPLALFWALLGATSVEADENVGRSPNVFEASSSYLDSLQIYDLLRSQSSTVTRDKGSNLDFFAAGNREIPLCHLSAIIPFTGGSDFLPRPNTFEHAMAAALAAQHLNTGDGSVVDAVKGLSERCPIRFTLEYADSQRKGGVALEHVKEQTSREMPGGRLPCAFLGASRSSVTAPMSIVTGYLGYPQVSGSSTSPDLDDRSQHPLFGRTVPSDAGSAVPIIIFLRDVVQIQHLAVINVNDEYGNAYVEAMRAAAEIHAPDLVIYQIPIDENESSIKAAVESLKLSEYRYVFCLVFGLKFHDTLLEEAYNQKVAGTGLHTWFFGDSFGGGLNDRTFPKDSPLHKAYQGGGLLEGTGGLPGLTRFDHYQDAMARLKNPNDMDYLTKHFLLHDVPEYIEGLTFLHEADFLQPVKSGYAIFTYEATITLGLAACEAYAKNQFFSGVDHFDHFKNTTYVGVSGTVAFDPVTGTRDPTRALFKVANFIGEEMDDPHTSEKVISFKSIVSNLYQDGEWNELEPYVFNDGTTNIPADLPPPIHENEEFNLGFVIGVTLGIAMVLAVVVFLFYENKRKQSDAIWKIKKEEIKFGEVPEVIGQGAFGEVLLAEYRGTQVVVKRGIAEKGKSGKEMESAESAPSTGTGSSLGMKSVNVSSAGYISGYRSTAQGKGSISRAKRRSDFLKEMRALSKLRHPCITTIMGKYLFMVMVLYMYKLGKLTIATFLDECYRSCHWKRPNDCYGVHGTWISI